MHSQIPGTVVIYGPHFQRSGFGLLARVWAMALHQAGISVRIVPVDCNDPNTAGDLDDCDLYTLRALQYTPVKPPVTAIFAYVPIYVWPKMQLPEPHLRILLTTFDSSGNAAVPPTRLIYIGNQMDQIWVANRTEEAAWIRGGCDSKRIHSFNWPHNWIDNSILPPVKTKTVSDGVFRFLHISLFLPRRRLDVLIRAFFEEYRAKEAELVLKMTFPTWHPKPWKPKKDLYEMVARLRSETESRASVTVDESLGTRLDLVRLIDSCDAYVSPDTTNTAPVSEAIIRRLPVIITDGWGVDLPPQCLVVPNSPKRVAITPEMAEYMPHQRGTSFPALDVGLMRQALRRVFSWSAEERGTMVEGAARYMEERYSYAATAPVAIAAIRKGWDDQRAPLVEVTNHSKVRVDKTAPKTTKPLNVHWCGLQLFYGKIPKANREICLELLRRGHGLSLMPGNGPFHIEELDLGTSPKYQQLARQFYEPLKGDADYNVSFRWHPIFNENPAARQILGNTWWHGTIPTDWIKPINERVTEVWTPSHFVRDNFQRSGIAAGQLQVIPLGIDPTVFRPGLAPYPLRTRKRFKFLFVGETTQRKGLDVLLNAYLRIFRRRDDVCLVIKDMDCEDYYGCKAASELIRRCQADSRAPEIEYITAMLPEEALASLYAACDCFVQPHRVASFGLAVMEAMACGLPVITTNYGGILEFCNDQNAFLLPAREVRQRQRLVGHWKVNGEQLHAEVNQRALQERMEDVFKNFPEAKKKAQLASDHIRANFTWEQTVDRIERRFRQLQTVSTRHRPGPSLSRTAAAPAETNHSGPTLIIFAPFYNRSGYGVAARSLATALHGAGMKIKIVPVDNVEAGINDCDMTWLKSLEKTPVTTPVVAVFFHVPGPHWLQVQLPRQSLRVMFTTFDSSAQGNLPPADWIPVINEMDQLWLMTEREVSVFAAAGVPGSKIHLVKSPHPWIDNPVLPLPQITPKADRRRFRFLNISMFLPRRRWDTLIEAFLTEFKDAPGSAELYLKVNYPAWHPLPGQPQKDLHQLVEALRARTESRAEIILDESLDTRLGICRLIDSCDAYVSTDTSITAPVGEAFVRGKIAVIPDGYGAALPYCEGALVVPVDPKLAQPMTEAMLAYQPHHRGRPMPLLRVEDVRRTLRAAFELPEAERLQKGRLAGLFMECTYGAPVVVPKFVKAINSGLREKFSPAKSCSDASNPSSSMIKLEWEGSFLDHGSLSQVNRELTRALQSLPDLQLKRVGNGAAIASDAAMVWPELAREVSPASSLDVAITVRHAWPPNWKRPDSGKLVVIQPWEFGVLPEEWVRQSCDVDEFWVPSEYVRRVYAESGVPLQKVFVVPNGVDAKKFQPSAVPMKLATQKKFKFLFVGGTIGRKGPDLLLQAYLKNFTADDDVCLVIKDFGGKSFYAGKTFESQIRSAQSLPHAPEILYLNEELPPDSLPGLYAACDCFVLPYRGEGFGLPVLEAMACGLPVIVTAGGATDDFVRDEFAWRIPAPRKIIGNEVGGMKLVNSGWLLEPDIGSLGEKLRHAFLNPDEVRERGRFASRHAHQFFSWENSAAIVARRLQELAARKGTPAKSVKVTPAALPPVAQIGRLDEARELVRQKKIQAAWEATLAAISKRPFHPEAFLLLAEIAFAAGDSNSARQCAQHARNLAPDWNPARQFLKKSFKGNLKPEWLRLPDAIQNAKSKTPTVSVCLIVKNEEQFIGQCLRSIHGLARQIIVVDTGSTDSTVEIAKEFGAEIHSFKWCDDFAAARNAALEHATGDWILMLDADEELPADQHAKLLADMKKRDAIACRLPLINRGHEAEGASHVPRLFRNAPGVYYSGRIHEQVFASLLARSKSWGLPTSFGTARLLHHGYTEESVRDRNKIERNLRLLRLAVAENPADANLMMNLGLELVRSYDLREGVAKYREAFELMSAQPPEEVPVELREVLLTQFTCQLYKICAYDEVMRVLNSPLAKQGGLTASLHFALGLARFELKQYREAAEQMRQCLAMRQRPVLSPINTDILTAAPNHCLALSLAKLNDAAGAERAFQAALTESGRLDDVKLDYAKFLAAQNRPVEALHKMHELIAANSRNHAAWRTGGEIALSRVEFLEFARDWTGEAMRYVGEDPVVVAQRAEALMLSGETMAAIELWERAWTSSSQPAALAALILCETLESPATHAPQDEHEEAAASRAFIEWYRKLLSVKAHKAIVRLNGQTDKLSRALPGAAKIIEATVAEVENANEVKA